MKAPHIPTDAPFSGEQRSWIGGFIAGLNSQRLLSGSYADAEPAKSATLMNVLYGTQTGNAEELANDAAVVANGRGYSSKLNELDAIDMVALSQMEHAVIVVSTYGEGEMPDNANLFWDAVSAQNAPRLEHLNYAVLALGDTSYDEFCQAGKLIDTRLEQLGAVRMAPRIDCDVDYDSAAAEWLDKAIPVAPNINGGTDEDEGPRSAPIDSTVKKPKWNKKNPYGAKLIENSLLSGEGSAKEIRHISFDLGDSEIAYQAGDALGVIPHNASDLVAAILNFFHVNFDKQIDGYDVPIGILLTEKYEIMTPSREFIHEIEKRASNRELSQALGNKAALEKILWGKDILDLLDMLPDNKLDVEEFLSWLRPLQHRAYSISSSSKVFSSEIHLTVAAVRWNYQNREHKGVASTFLSDRVELGETTGIFLSQNKNFRVPSDDDVPMVMVGPGTGVAPFRAFLQERQAREASGMNWLFFGDQHKDYDFLYQDELAAMCDSGLLNRLDLAFSRDQSEKIYVQTRMLERGKHLFSALEEGGHFYVCGDASRMAKDVEKALHEVVGIHGGLTADGAIDYINNLKREKRYLRDVY